ncbi:enediyne antibiotic chromoprotein [Kibdelosporangium phytohabitans]|uniref:Neocarzinostatin n=1 Tax=Kibdelosporangium phytohabitans TaxID=860235 RepID=A0A0N9HY91_9PSEU|nr:enediyne antibiotic chromoprotein [Kibdelosporangium phytohabitans]ALG08589.1 hypothetical protein AOZ06_18175 [Kibdelosporangium phytohabitans]MBE1470329.1 hypothetical protein [Kibdelosporangium phytohabitans]
MKFRKFGIAAAAIGLAVAFSPSALADAPSVTATPSTGLADGQTVSAAVAGFAAGEEVIVAQCAQPGGVIVCDWANTSRFNVDDSGSGSGALVVHAAYQGTTQTGEPYGTVDCATVEGGCKVGAINATYTTLAATPISFG